MAITLGTRSLSRLEGVHPDLVKIVKTAAEIATADLDFTVVEGLRSIEQMCINYGKGRTVQQCTAKGVPAKYSEPSAAKVTWLANPFLSKHGASSDGFGHAVDLAPFPIDWKDNARFHKLGDLMKRAAVQAGIAGMTWGGDWTKPDMPHFELSKR